MGAASGGRCQGSSPGSQGTAACRCGGRLRPPGPSGGLQAVVRGSRPRPGTAPHRPVLPLWGHPQHDRWHAHPAGCRAPGMSSTSPALVPALCSMPCLEFPAQSLYELPREKERSRKPGEPMGMSILHACSLSNVAAFPQLTSTGRHLAGQHMHQAACCMVSWYTFEVKFRLIALSHILHNLHAPTDTGAPLHFRLAAQDTCTT